MPAPRYRALVPILAFLFTVAPVSAKAQDSSWRPAAPWPAVTPRVSSVIEKLMADPKVKRAMEFLREDDARAIREMIVLTEIPAPSFEEGPKAIEFLSLALASGLSDSRLDKTGNAIAMRRGRGNGDLFGVKGLVRDTPNIAAFIGFEPLPIGAISIQNTASVRYEVRYSAPGGHSFAAFGEVPGGITPPDSPIIQASLAAIRATGNKELAMVGVSTNAGVPIAAGIPTVVLAPGGKMFGFHALSEAIDPTGTWQGAQTALLTLLAIAGIDGLPEPLAEKR